MFFPRHVGIFRSLKGRNKYGEPIYTGPIPVRCSIIHLKASSEKTTVRADSSASRGSAEEEIADAKLLLPPALHVFLGDHFTINGFELLVTKIEPRYNVLGKHDHNEIDFAVAGHDADPEAI
jgi:hypothetical protein